MHEKTPQLEIQSDVKAGGPIMNTLRNIENDIDLYFTMNPSEQQALTTMIGWAQRTNA